MAFCLLPLLQPFTQKYAVVVLLLPAIVAGRLAWLPGVRPWLYLAIAAVLIQPIMPGAAAQRLMQVLGVDFLAMLFLAVAVGRSLRAFRASPDC